MERVQATKGGRGSATEKELSQRTHNHHNQRKKVEPSRKEQRGGEEVNVKEKRFMSDQRR